MTQTDVPHPHARLHTRLPVASATTVAVPRSLGSERLALAVAVITLAAFAVAEVITVYTDPLTGIALHATTLSALLIGAGFGGQDEGTTEQGIARLLHTLALVPLIRIVSLTM